MLQICSLINAGRARLRGQATYHSLRGNGHANGPESRAWEKSKQAGKTYCSPLHGRRSKFAIACSLLILLFIFFFSPINSDGSSADQDHQKTKCFRLVIPASQAETNLCKTLVSAAILGYSPPMLVNWDQTFDEPNLIFGGSRLAKIQGVLGQLRAIEQESDNDLVLVVDGYDVWFQLRPNVLIERYFDINRRADERLRNHLGQSVMNRERIAQRVVFSAQKRCWPKRESDPSCWAVPESILPGDVYGPETDTSTTEEKNPYLKFRQRYLNSGSVVGPVAAVRQVFERAADISLHDKNIGSDQGVLAQIFGEQEFHRHHVAMRSRNLFRRLADWVLKNTGRDYSYRLIDPEKQGTHDFAKFAQGTRYEYGIGLDYESRILQSTVFSEYDNEWIQYGDEDGIRKISKSMGIPGSGRVKSISADIMTSLAPFYDLSEGKYSGTALPVEKSWKDVPLSTNMWTGVTPVAIHHNAHKDNMKSRIQTHWNKTWYQQSARALLSARVLMPEQPIAVTNANGAEQKWYSPPRYSWSDEWNNLDTDQGYQLRFDRLCAGAWQELFGDDTGEWTDPRRPLNETGDGPIEVETPQGLHFPIEAASDEAGDVDVEQPEDYPQALHAPGDASNNET